MYDLLSMIKKASVDAVENGKPFSAIMGAVETINPISIRISQNIVLYESQLILTDAVRNHKTEISFDRPDILQVVTNWNMSETEESSKYKISHKEKIKHEVTVYNDLKQGEGVILLRTQGGQRFIVLDRIEARR